MLNSNSVAARERLDASKLVLTTRDASLLVAITPHPCGSLGRITCLVIFALRVPFTALHVILDFFVLAVSRNNSFACCRDFELATLPACDEINRVLLVIEHLLVV